MKSEVFQCLTCKGQYSTPQRGGQIYMHVCPPLVGDDPGVTRDRPNARNENPVDRERPATAIVAEGKGVKCLSNPKLQEPQWITERKSKLAREKLQHAD